MGPPVGSRLPVGLFSTGHEAKNLEEVHNKENQDKMRTLVSLRMLSQSTKALVESVNEGFGGANDMS